MARKNNNPHQYTRMQINHKQKTQMTHREETPVVAHFETAVQDVHSDHEEDITQSCDVLTGLADALLVTTSDWTGDKGRLAVMVVLELADSLVATAPPDSDDDAVVEGELECSEDANSGVGDNV
jgi:hypothetical protein